MNSFILCVYVLFTTSTFNAIRCNVTATNPKSQIWFADANLHPTQPSNAFSRQNTQVEESEETVQVIPHDPLSAGEEISAESLELKQHKQEKRVVGSIQWDVTSKPVNITKTTLALRNHPNRGKFSNKSNSVAGSGSAPVTAMTMITSKVSPDVIMLDPQPAKAPLKPQPQVFKTVRYRTWTSNFSTSDLAPKNQTSIVFPGDRIFSPSNEKMDQKMNPEAQPSHISSKRKRPVLYYIPKKAFVPRKEMIQHDEDRRRGKHRYVQPIDYDDYSTESDESYEDFENMRPMSYRQFIKHQFTPPTIPPAPAIPKNTTVIYRPQTVQTTTPLTVQVLSTRSVANTQLTTVTPSSITKTSVTSDPTIAMTLAEASYKKQTYLDHPIAYLISHLPTSTHPALPTHPSELGLSADIVPRDTLKTTQIPFTSSAPRQTVATRATLAPIVQTQSVAERATLPPVAQRQSVRARPTLPPVVQRPTENTLESAENESSEEDDYDEDEDEEDDDGNNSEDSRPSKARPAVEYSNDDDADYSEEEYDEPEPSPPPPPKYKKNKSRKVYYKRRPAKAKPVDYQDYDSVEMADRKRPAAVYVERINPVKTRQYKKYADTKPIYYVKGGRYPTNAHHHQPRRHPARKQHRRQRMPLQLVQTADGQQYYIANGNWIAPSKNPNVVLAYDHLTPSPVTKTPNVLLAADSQYTNHPGKIKWLNQLTQSKGTAKPTIIYQHVVPGVNIDSITEQMHPYQVYTGSRGIQYPVFIGNSSINQQATQQLLVPSVHKRPRKNYVKVVTPAHAKLNQLENDGYYAVLDSNGQLTPAQLVFTKPKSEKVYNFVETRRKQPTNTITYKCNWNNCQLPDCFCGTNTFIPGNLKVSEVPQMILLTFDDSVNEVNYPLYQHFLEKRKNPNNCPVTATFYVSNEWTDYSKIQNLYLQGHEMASHSISHGDGGRYSSQKWEEEILGQKELLKTLGGVRDDDVKGMRAPFLQPGGDKQFTMLQLTNFTYDSSLPVRRSDPPIWPYTLDYGVPHECNIPPCPRGRYPGLWEVPLVMWTDLTGGRCSMADACTTPTNSDDIYRMLMSNFEHHYHSNRAPFPMYYHYAWFTKSQNFEAFTTFIDTVLQLGDVYMVTVSQMIEWMKQPTPLSRIQEFAPWKCENQNHTANLCLKPQTCSYILANGKEQVARTCQPCESNSKNGN